MVQSPAAPRVSVVAVIGAGALGRAIAQAAALGGYRTIVEDVLPGSLRKAQHEFRNALIQAVGAGEIASQDADAALARLQYAGSVEEAARPADLVIEAVPDEWESKSEIFILLDKICRPGTILATSTAALSVTELASVTYRPAQCVGLRFVRRGRLEIVRGNQSSEDTLAAVLEVGKRLGREVLVEEETAGSPFDIHLSQLG